MNQVMSKAGSEVILKSFLGMEIDVDALPWGPEDERVPAGIETIVMAEEVRPARGRRVEVVEVKREEGGVRKVVVGTVDGEGMVDGEGGDVVVVKDEPEE